MKTQPSLQPISLQPALPILTDVNTMEQTATGKETERLSFTRIKLSQTLARSGRFPADSSGVLSAPKLDCYNAFAYEKSRMEALQRTEIFTSLQTLAHASDQSMVSSTVTSASTATLRASSSASARDSEPVFKVHRIVTIILMLYAAANVVLEAFAVLYLSAAKLPLAQYLLWLVLELLLTAAFLFVAVKGHGLDPSAEASRGRESTCWSLIRTITLILLSTAGVLIAGLYKTPYSSLQCAVLWGREGNTYDEDADAMKCIVVAAVFFSSLAKLVISATYLGLGLAVRAAFCRMIIREELDRPARERGETSAAKLAAR